MHGFSLKTFPYGENSQIITIFTKDWGLVQAIGNKSRKNLSFQNASAPPALSDWELSRKGGSLFKIKEVSLIDPFLEIRKDLSKIEAVGAIMQSLLKTQIAEKPSPLLYALLKSYFLQMKKSLSPKILSLSFSTKVLKFEGLFSPNKRRHTRYVYRFSMESFTRFGICQIV